MIPDCVIERLSNISLEEALEEVETLAKVVTPPQSHKWFNIYEDLINDRRAYRMMGVEEHYAGEKDGRLNPLADARLKLLAFYGYLDQRREENERG